jgi:hypothetical protein
LNKSCLTVGSTSDMSNETLPQIKTFPLYSLCRNAAWECRPATPQESEEFPKTGAMVAGCSRVENQEFTTCEPVDPVTCKVNALCIYLVVADHVITFLNYVVHKPSVYFCYSPAAKMLLLKYLLHISQWIGCSQIWDSSCPH